MNPKKFVDPNCFQDDIEGEDEGIINDDDNTIRAMIRCTLPDEVFQRLVTNPTTQ